MEREKEEGEVERDERVRKKKVIRFRCELRVPSMRSCSGSWASNMVLLGWDLQRLGFMGSN